MLLLSALAGCGSGPEAPPLDPGTYVQDSRWWTGRSTLPLTGPGQVRVVGEIAVIEGDALIVSGSTGALGLRFDEERNDVAAIVRRYAEQVADPPAVLVLFTSFNDLGGGGPAYAIPIQNRTPGLGFGPIDQRQVFGAEGILSVANMKRPEDHQALVPLLAHEIAHVDLAHLDLVPGTTTSTAGLLGRQRAHWSAALHTEGSVLEGYGYAEIAPGSFVVNAKRSRFSELDLYGLGLLPPSEVRPFFRIDDAVVESGAKLPVAAELTIGDHVFGRRVEIDMQELVRVMGRRPARESKEIWALFALVTAPGERWDDPGLDAKIAAVDEARRAIEVAWPTLTRGKGTLRTTLPERADAGVVEADAGSLTPPPASGCGCQSGGGSGMSWMLTLVILGARRRPRRAPWRGDVLVAGLRGRYREADS